MTGAVPHRRAVLAGLGGFALMSAATGQAAEPGRSDADMVSDWPWLGRYAADNAERRRNGQRTDMVFIGDSITELWMRERPAYFPPARANRGIGGQTSPQILLRMMADVVALRPRAVHIMAGTNDVAGNTGPISPDQTLDNLAAMVAVASAHGIAVVLATVPPAATFWWRPAIVPRAAIDQINTGVRAMAADDHQLMLADYHPLMADHDGAMRADLSGDGVHPNANGYAVMERLLDPIMAGLGISGGG